MVKRASSVDVVSAIKYGIIGGILAGVIFAMSEMVGVLTGTGMVWGLVLWLVNFYLIAPVAFPWFGMANPVVQFITHVFFFGAVLGYVLSTRLAKPGPASLETQRPSQGE